MSETTDGLNGRQLAKLLSAAWDTEPSAGGNLADETLHEALAEALASPAPQAPGDAPLRDVLLGRAGALDALRHAKQFGRDLATSPSEQDRAVGTAVYYAAIAAALARHDRRITRHATDAIALSLADLEKRTWIGDELRMLYARGREACGTYIADDHEED